MPNSDKPPPSLNEIGYDDVWWALPARADCRTALDVAKYYAMSISDRLMAFLASYNAAGVIVAAHREMIASKFGQARQLFVPSTAKLLTANDAGLIMVIIQI